MVSQTMCKLFFSLIRVLLFTDNSITLRNFQMQKSCKYNDRTIPFKIHVNLTFLQNKGRAVYEVTTYLFCLFKLANTCLIGKNKSQSLSWNPCYGTMMSRTIKRADPPQQPCKGANDFFRTPCRLLTCDKKCLTDTIS